MRLRTLTLLLLTLSLTKISAQETHLETCLTLDSNEVVYTLKQDLNCIKCLMQAPLKDSLISQYKDNELTADTIIYQLQSNINDLNNLNTEQGKKITRLRWNVLKGIVCGVVAGIGTTVLVIIL